MFYISTNMIKFWKQKDIYKSEGGLIYKIVSDDEDNLTYYGSTEKTSRNRLKSHIRNYKNKKGNCSSFKVLEKGKIYLEVVEVYNGSSRKELFEREKYYIQNFDCVNFVMKKCGYQLCDENNFLKSKLKLRYYVDINKIENIDENYEIITMTNKY